MSSYNMGKGGTMTDLELNLSCPFTAGYDQFVRKIFHPNSRILDNEDTEKGISARSMLKMVQKLGKAAIDDQLDDQQTHPDNLIDSSPLSRLGQELEANGLTDSSYMQFHVYQPKKSNEYFTTMYSRPPINNGARSRGVYASNRRHNMPNVWAPSNQTTYRVAAHSRQYVPPGVSAGHMLVDNENFESFPLSPYMYLENPYIHKEDTRIVGSKFVMLNLRSKDDLLNKIDKTLAMARDFPRYC